MTAAPAEGPLSSATFKSRRAIVVVDVVESVRLMQEHETDTVDRWRRFIREVVDEVLAVRGGRLVKSLGDGLLLEFEKVPAAAATALDLQRRIGAYNVNRSPDALIGLRMGIHVSDVVIDELDIYGRGVNLAARLSTLAAAGEVVVSDEVRDLLVPGVDPDVEDLGECFLKHIDGAVRAYRLGARTPSLILQSVLERRAREIRPGVAVIPFECSIGHDPGDMIGEALADEVISTLARTVELHVISGLSTRTLKGRRLGTEEVAKHLGAAYVLSGRYRMGVDQFRLSLELAEIASHRVVWAEAFDSSTQAAFDPRAPLADAIVMQVSRSILVNELDLALTRPLPSLESYTILLGAITLMHRASASQFDRSRQMLEHLAERLGRRAVAHAWLAKWHVLRVVQGWAPNPAMETALALDEARKALDANPQNALALAIAGLVHGYLRKDLATADRLYSDARTVNPNEPLAWLFSATLHAYRGEPVAADLAGDMALRLSPLDPLRYFFDSPVATASLAGSHWDRAIELAQRSIRANRLHASTWRTLAYALVMAGRVDEARTAVAELLVIEPNYTVGAFRERFPGRDGPMAEPWARALAIAGLAE